MSAKPTTGEKMIRRFMIMLKILYSRQGLNINELCKEFGISLRTLQRNIPRLQDYYDIELEKGKDGKYYISRTGHEDGSLSFGDIETFSQKSGVGDLYPKLDAPMIADVLNASVSKSFSVTNEPKQSSKALRSMFESIAGAILEYFIVSFYYNGSQRIAKPYKLINIAGVWYLLADEKAKLKHFTLSKIKNCEIIDKTFTPSNIFLKCIEENNLKWLNASAKTARILVLPEAREYFERKKIFSSFKVLKDDKNGILLEVNFAFDDELLNVVKA
ncbi:helix-turn-helix transcriptional regulator [Campylobacter devanensis]|uniref:helix-turn-helix transcriptional regulator n=1 Tax=Campylobacter devanensis TaxID=3161138 RepID=UPI000A345EDD|nr:MULTISPECIES: WYL domain-containing protein [unclassified Campylobacter]